MDSITSGVAGGMACKPFNAVFLIIRVSGIFSLLGLSTVGRLSSKVGGFPKIVSGLE